MSISAKVLDATIMTTAAIILVVFCVFPVLYKIEAMEELKVKTIIELTQKGVDPIAARCSIAADDDYICVVYVSSKSASNGVSTTQLIVP